jgi:hypothetical protein
LTDGKGRCGDLKAEFIIASGLLEDGLVHELRVHGSHIL